MTSTAGRIDLPFDLEQYPYLKNIIEKAYGNGIVYKSSVNGSHDTNWTKEYELFYNTQPNSAPYVKRIFFGLSGEKKKRAGFVNIRPRTEASEVCETYLIPPIGLAEGHGAYVKCLDEHAIYGEKIRCVPYIMPETIFGMCIHAAIWICLKILENKSMIQKAMSIPEIQTLATGHPYSDKSGLVFVQAARILKMCRTSVFYIINVETPQLTDDEMLMEIYSYIESGLPVIVGVDVADLAWWDHHPRGYHSIVSIGHTMKDNQISGFVFHDESVLPYQILSIGELLNAWHTPSSAHLRHKTREMLVAVPPEVSLPFHKVYYEFEEILDDLSKRHLTSLALNGLAIRPILQTPTEAFLMTKNMLMFRTLQETGFPSYVWVFYFFNEGADRENIQNAAGFFIRDATARTNLKFIYLKEEKQAIYHIEDRVYKVREDYTRKIRLR